MPITGHNTYALVILSLGILGVIVSFLIADKKKYYIALALSILVVVMGLFEFIGSGLRQWRTARRISKLQETQRLNLEALQSRLREAAEKSRGNKPSATAPAPAPAAPAKAAAPSPKKK